MSQPGGPPADGAGAAPAPGPALAGALSVGAALATSLLFLAFAPTMDPLASRALALVLGTGGVAALAATHIPPPHAERVGLRGIDARKIFGVLLLVPVALLSSELDNWARAWMEAPSPFAEAADPQPAVLWLQVLLVMVGIEPVIEEWFFRGILQQGSRPRLGDRGAVVWCALLFAVYAVIGRASSPADAIAVAAQSAALGVAFGYVRLVTGSLLAPVLLHASINAVAVFGSVWWPIAGFTGPGAHTDPIWLIAAAASCAIGVRQLKPAGADPGRSQDAEDREDA